MAGFYTALIGTSPTIQWPGLSPPCTIRWRNADAGAVADAADPLLDVGSPPAGPLDDNSTGRPAGWAAGGPDPLRRRLDQLVPDRRPLVRVAEKAGA